jgi:hypothetical protein
MANYSRGDVLLVRYPFTDLSGVRVRPAIVETREFSPNQFYFKVRAELPGAYRLQVRVYSNRGKMASNL